MISGCCAIDHPAHMSEGNKGVMGKGISLEKQPMLTLIWSSMRFASCFCEALETGAQMWFVYKSMPCSYPPNVFLLDLVEGLKQLGKLSVILLSFKTTTVAVQGQNLVPKVTFSKILTIQISVNSNQNLWSLQVWINKSLLKTFSRHWTMKTVSVVQHSIL